MGSNMLTPGSISFRPLGRKLVKCLWFLTPLIFCYTTHFEPMVSLWAAITSKGRRGHPKLIHFLNPECARILWVLAPKNVEIFLVRNVSPKSSLFHQYPCTEGEKRYQISVRSILMPSTVMPIRFQGYHWSWPGVKSLTGNADLCTQNRPFWDVLWTK